MSSREEGKAVASLVTTGWLGDENRHRVAAVFGWTALLIAGSRSSCCSSRDPLQVGSLRVMRWPLLSTAPLPQPIHHVPGLNYKGIPTDGSDQSYRQVGRTLPFLQLCRVTSASNSGIGARAPIG